MPALELIKEADRQLTICNACRYCERFCPVFPAIERRVTFARADLAYLANLCHNCGECLYACQYAPPHEFGINVPQTLAALRYRSFEEYTWPAWMSSAFRHQGTVTALIAAGGLTLALFAAVQAANPQALWDPDLRAQFYQVVPHWAMVTLFGTVGLTEAEAKERFARLEIYRAVFRPLKATLSGRDERTLVKLVVDAASQRVVGAHMVGPDAPEVVQGVAIAVKAGLTKAELDATVGIHPTAGEEFLTLREKQVVPGHLKARPASTRSGSQ